MARLTIHLFGSPRVAVDGETVEFDTRKAMALLAYLAVTGEQHGRDSLAALLWPDYDQTSARAALRRTLSTLNRPLGVLEAANPLVISREALQMAPSAAVWLDVTDFGQRLAACKTHGHTGNEVCPACIGELEAAAKLYPEPFMAGFNLRDSPNFEEWQFFQEESLRRELINALDRLVAGLEGCGRSEESIGYARRRLALDPLLEDAHCQLMALYSRAGQRNAALRQYRECVRILDQELGVAPLEETTRLYQKILNNEPLPQQTGRIRYVPESGVRAAAVAQTEGVTPVPQAARREVPAATSGPLVGRAAEWQQLEAAYQQGAEAFVVLVGEAGIGKTRLAEEFLAHTQQQGGRVIQARCYPGEAGLAYAPFIDALTVGLSSPETAARMRALPGGVLADVARLLPQLQALAPSQAENGGGQARFFESLRQCIGVLLGGEKSLGVLFLDDLQWADTATFDLLTYLVRRLAGTGWMVLGAWRNDSSETVQKLDRLAAEQARSQQAVVLRLERLGLDALTEWVRILPIAAALAVKNAGGVAERLYQESEGLPFIAAEYLAALAKSGEAGWEMPAGVRDLLHSHLAGLDSACMQLLGAAAVIGRSFDFHTLREASGRSEIEAIDGLEVLLSAGLVVERSTDGQEQYDFTHEKLRVLVYDETSLARRRLLHRRIAETLSHGQTVREELAGQVAYHYEQAGLNALAAPYHVQAGERARRLFANVEAMGHFQAALAYAAQAGQESAPVNPADLHQVIGDLHTLNGNYAAALNSYQAAAALCNPDCLAGLEYKLGNLNQRLGEWELAESHYLASLEALGDEGDPVLQVHLYVDRSLTAHLKGDGEQAQRFAARALELAERTGDALALAQAHNINGVLARATHRINEAIASLEHSLKAAQTLNDPMARIAALNNLALVYSEDGQLDKAIALAQEALELCIRRGDRHRQAALHNNLADLLHQAGREEQAMQQLKQAVVIFAEIGEEPGRTETSAEIWKLTEW